MTDAQQRRDVILHRDSAIVNRKSLREFNGTNLPESCFALPFAKGNSAQSQLCNTNCLHKRYFLGFMYSNKALKLGDLVDNT